MLRVEKLDAVAKLASAVPQRAENKVGFGSVVGTTAQHGGRFNKDDCPAVVVVRAELIGEQEAWQGHAPESIPAIVARPRAIRVGTCAPSRGMKKPLRRLHREGLQHLCARRDSNPQPSDP